MTKKIISGLAALSAAAALLGAPPVRAAARTGGSCASVRIPVALLPGQPENKTIAGTLCTPGSWDAGPHRVDVLVHGATYNGAYWDWPLSPGTYSYARKTMNAGRAAFTYDRLGAGSSSRPLGAEISAAADSFVLHQLVQWLRARDLAQVTVIGHSLGSIIAMNAAATYPDLQRLVITGMAHLPGLGPGSVGLFGSFYPALLDPLFAGQMLDATYLTTLPGTRGGSFYHTSTADPQVIAYDEAHKDIASYTEVVDALTKLAVPAGLNDTNRIQVPVLVVLGQNDTLLCGLLLSCAQSANVRANEAPYYSSAPSLTAAVVPGTGHSIALHPSAGQSFTLIDQWIRSH